MLIKHFAELLVFYKLILNQEDFGIYIIHRWKRLLCK
ncbi:MAG: hypothetical protein K0S76_1203 [Herbinix sp.]|jgi:hypothetical protein|nr:hypothetical protein [Herbinix sp.]